VRLGAVQGEAEAGVNAAAVRGEGERVELFVPRYSSCVQE
jgi:hypothetical protein